MRYHWRLVLVCVLILAGLVLTPAAPAGAAGTVGDGTASSCTPQALEAAFDGGGTVSFNCGPAPVIISVLNTIAIEADTQIDGGGLVTLLGLGSYRLFSVNAGVTFALSNITLRGGSADLGGAIYNDHGTITITNSTLHDNHATTNGGAIYSNQGTVTINNSTLIGNTASNGGAISNNAGIVNISGSALHDNEATSNGGAINSLGGGVTITTSTLSGNNALEGGAIYANGQDLASLSTLAITSSTLSGNTATSDGGAIYNTTHSSLNITSSTLSGNQAHDGGAVFNTDSSVTSIFTSTLNDNHATENGGSIYNQSTFTLRSTIIANSNVFNCFNSQSLSSHSFNLSDDESCNLSATLSDVVNAEPLLAALADNGGPTQTHLPQTGSPVIDRIPALLCSGIAIDQRGVFRPQNDLCDIGSVEVDGNLPPSIQLVTATPDQLTVGASSTITVTATDPADDDDGTLSYAFDCNGDGSFEVGPQPSSQAICSFLAVGQAEVFVNVSDSGGSSVTASVVVFVTSQPPVANDDAYSTDDSTLLSIAAPGVLGNDTDVDSTMLFASQVSGPSNGSLTLNRDGSFAYTPNPGFSGVDTFTYVASDGTVSSVEATVTITVTLVNVTPIASGDSYGTSEDASLTIPAAGVLGNDSDADNDPLSAALIDSTDNGDLTLNPDGSFTYTPIANFHGSDSFTYKASDGFVESSAATVTITVASIDDLPVAADDSYSMVADTQLSIDGPGVLGNDNDLDGDPLTAAIGTGPSHGSLTLNADGSFTYTSTTGYVGNDSFTYQANGGLAESNAATVTITINPDNSAPAAANDSYSTNEDTPLTIPVAGVLSNDTDSDNDPLTAVLENGPSNGILELNPDGSFSYTPNTNFNGIDSFTYKVNDGELDSTIATVTITVNAVNDLPTAAAGGPYSVAEGSSISVSASGTDVEDATLTFAWDLDGDTMFETPGQIVTFSAAILDGPTTQTITVQVSDGDGGKTTAAAEVTIMNVDPVVSTFAANASPALTGHLVTFMLAVSDVPGDSLTMTYDCGEATAARDDGCLYTRGGSYAVSVLVEDGDGGKATADLTLEVYDQVSLCVVIGNGSLSMASRDNDCGWGATLIELPQPNFESLSICVNKWNGAARASEDCGRSEHRVTTAGQDTLAVCVNRWNGALRVSNNCSRSEREDWL